MLSSGIRVGAWDWLKWKHIIPIERDGAIVAAKIIVYAGEPEQYFSFITSEAYKSLKNDMDFRELHGDKIALKITNKNPVIPITTIDKNDTVNSNSVNTSLERENQSNIKNEVLQPYPKIENNNQQYCIFNQDKSILYKCYYCDFIPTNDKDDYEKHVVLSHDRKLAYPSLADLEKNNLKPKGKHWEI
jgi:uncharacterized C2H2 Zn-finger protein